MLGQQRYLFLRHMAIVPKHVLNGQRDSQILLLGGEPWRQFPTRKEWLLLSRLLAPVRCYRIGSIHEIHTLLISQENGNTGE